MYFCILLLITSRLTQDWCALRRALCGDLLILLHYCHSGSQAICFKMANQASQESISHLTLCQVMKNSDFAFTDYKDQKDLLTDIIISSQELKDISVDEKEEIQARISVFVAKAIPRYKRDRLIFSQFLSNPKNAVFLQTSWSWGHYPCSLPADFYSWHIGSENKKSIRNNSKTCIECNNISPNSRYLNIFKRKSFRFKFL